MSNYIGDFDASDIVDVKFTTVGTTGAPTTLAGTPAISVYKDNSTTQSTTGVTLTVDFDSVTGLHHCRIDTSADGSFYAAGSDFQVVITTGTVGGTSVVGYVVGAFSIRNRAALYATTAGRTLDVSAGGEAGVDWANVGSPTTTLNLSGTTVKTATDVETDTADIQSRLPAALVGGRMDSSVGAMAANVITAAATASDFVTEIATGVWDALTSGMSTVGSIGKKLADWTIHSAADVWAAGTRTLTAGTNIALAKGTGVTGFNDLSAADVRTAVGLASANLDTQLDALPTAAENAAALLDLSNGVETSITPRQALRLILAASAGKLSGAATTTIVIRNVGDTADRITATVDASGNRTAVTVNGS